MGGSEFPVEICNVSVAASAQIERGMLLAGESTIYDVASDAADADKNLCIAAENFTADSLGGVTQAYFSGKFNRSAIILGGESLAIDPFEASLRKQNIHLTEVLK